VTLLTFPQLVADVGTAPQNKNKTRTVESGLALEGELRCVVQCLGLMDLALTLGDYKQDIGHSTTSSTALQVGDNEEKRFRAFVPGALQPINIVSLWKKLDFS
jgi:hypothetical protein